MGEPTPSPSPPPSTLPSVSYASLSSNSNDGSAHPYSASTSPPFPPSLSTNSHPLPVAPKPSESEAALPAAPAENTPSKSKHSLNAQGLYGTMPEARDENIKDVGRRVFEIDIANFFTRILPYVDDDEVMQVFNSLQASGTLDSGTAHWTHFKVAGEPKNQTVHESIVFKPIGDLAREIIKAARGLNKEVQFVYDSRPESAPESSECDNSSQPDGYFVLKTAETDLETFKNMKKPWWRNLTLICEFKKADNVQARNDDVCKVLWGMKHTMCEDLRRRFIYGLTIENTTARLWFSDRSQVIVSSPFNFIEETSPLVRLLYTFIYFKPTALGWDDSMTVIGSGETKKLTYSVTVGARNFRTFGPQVHNAAVSLMGRNTRVWNAREDLGPRGLSNATYVIKDTWTDEDRRREGDIYDILYKLPLSADEKSFFGKLLLKKECHADVVVDKAPDITLDLSDIKNKRRGFEINYKESTKDPKPRYTNDVTPSSFHHQRENALPPLIKRGKMVHNRIVFREFGTPLHSIDSLVQAFTSIGEVAIGLYILHKHGWVHRDISTGNILVCRDGTTKLVDFEYAKRYDDRTTHPMRTGTENYMAVEVDFRSYRFLSDQSTGTEPKQPEINAPVKPLWDVLMAPVKARKDGVDKVVLKRAKKPHKPQPVFVHNPLHDLESLNWAGINILADRRIVSVDSGKKRPHEDNHPLLYEQHEWARRLFFNSKERLNFLTMPDLFNEFIETLDPRVQPLGDFLQRIFTELVARYKLAEKDVKSIDFNVAGDLYAYFKPSEANDIDLEEFEGIRIGKIDYEALEEISERSKLRRLF